MTLELLADASHAVHDDAKDHGGSIARIYNANVFTSSTE